MRKFLKSILLFIPFSLAIYIVLIVVWGEVFPQFLKPNLNYKLGSYGNLYSRINEAKKVKDVNILFLGSSLAYRSFDTRIFKNHGYNTFNFGSSSYIC